MSGDNSGSHKPPKASDSSHSPPDVIQDNPSRKRRHSWKSRTSPRKRDTPVSLALLKSNPILQEAREGAKSKTSPGILRQNYRKHQISVGSARDGNIADEFSIAPERTIGSFDVEYLIENSQVDVLESSNRTPEKLSEPKAKCSLETPSKATHDSKFDSEKCASLAPGNKRSSATSTSAVPKVEDTLEFLDMALSVKLKGRCSPEMIEMSVFVTPEVKDSSEMSATVKPEIKCTQETSGISVSVTPEDKCTPETSVLVTPKVKIKYTPETSVLVTPRVNYAPETSVSVTPKVKCTSDTSVLVTPKVKIKHTPETSVFVRPKVKCAPETSVSSMSPDVDGKSETFVSTAKFTPEIPEATCTPKSTKTKSSSSSSETESERNRGQHRMMSPPPERSPHEWKKAQTPQRTSVYPTGYSPISDLEGSLDLSAFAMPLLDGDSADMSDSGEFRGRPRSSSGSSALKGLLGGKAKHRNKSSERDGDRDKDRDKKADKDGSSKVKSFFDTFRPRSKSDASALQRPKKKPQVQMEHSMDESTLAAQVNNKLHTGSQEVLTPMGQILEGQMLSVPDNDPRLRHKSGPQSGKDGFMSKFRARSNSDSKPKSPRKPLMTQKSFSPPNSPRLADRSGLSPLRLQSGEPRSAPPGMQRSSLSGDGPTHAIIYKSDVLNRLSVDSDRMEIEDLDENEDLVFAKFMKTHKCYDLIPTSAKLVIFDTQLNVKKAFFALVYNGVRAAPLWDSERQDYVGMLTITDFINILKKYYKSPEVRMDELEDHKIATWREVLREKQMPFVSICPDASLFQAVKTLIDTRVHRLPVVDETTGNALHILTHKRILRFLHLFIKDLPQPSYMKKSVKELGIGTYDNVITVSPDTMLIKVLSLFAENRISALPVVDNNTGKVISIYAKFDVIHLAAEKMYNNLEITLGEALKMRQSNSTSTTNDHVATCRSSDSLQNVLYNIVKAEVHRLVVVDECGGVEGIVSLSDLLHYTIIRPMAEENDTKSS